MLSEKKLESKTEQLSIINQFSSSLLQITHLDELFDYVTSQVVKRLGFVDCVIYLTDQNQNWLEAVAYMGVAQDTERYEVLQQKIPIEAGITGHVARTKKPFISGNVSQEPMYIADSRPALSELCVPLVYKEHLIGVIDCEHPEKDYFSANHLQILSTVAHLLSAKIHQVRTVDHLTATVSQLNDAQLIEKCILKIANITYHSRELDTFYDELYQIVYTLLPAENFFIGIYDTKQDMLEIEYLIEGGIKCPAQQKVSKSQLKQTASYYVIRTQSALLCNREQFQSHINKGDFNMVGRSPHAWLGVPFVVNDQYQGVIVLQSYEEEDTFSSQHYSILTYISRQISMAIDRRLAKQALEHRALHDELTGLANRYLLIERMKHAILSLGRSQTSKLHCLIYLDLDRFKSINDSLGHEVGDKFLIAIVEAIQTCIRKTDTFARLGGDEFAIFMENINHEVEVAQALSRITEAIAKPFVIDTHILQASSSIGVAFTEKDSDNAITLLQQSDAAMYEAKSAGRSQIRYFNNAMRSKLKHQADIENDLQHGIQNGEFELFFQPIFTLNAPKVVSFESLVRWHHPKNGLVAPDQFIPIAENTGQIIELDLHILDLAAKQLAKWQQQNLPSVKVTVNVSSRHFASLEFIDHIRAFYEKYDLQHGSLCLEITESGLIENLGLATKIIEGITPLGVQLYLDDFGTGYSALGYLHQLPIHVLKIDKSFVDQLTTKDTPLIDAILSLAKSLQLEVVAEGIETPKQWALLKRKGCQLGQGYLVSKPMPNEQAMSFLVAQNAKDGSSTAE
ncbi:diguanylate phosphodiesterase [Pseudoalteromonas luteoviolacea]|uniref:Diguanylate phosphodiesterase n=1 Tax=Pseudoalteromonas luteoviolacea TaxID=43657 RepID=A0A1C0TJR5_9GAMM|nr:EAL domain-containing protein [Pseudoalteromonas luteoviolacea]OCQ18442.1 diguanylate phosphodiesterase [Pseudoalteromonas luteoviolacea]